MKKIKFFLQPPISLEQHLIGLSLLFGTIKNISIINKMIRLRKSLAVFNNLRNTFKELLETLISNRMLNESSNSYNKQSQHSPIYQNFYRSACTPVGMITCL